MLTLVCNTYILDTRPLKNKFNIFYKISAAKYHNISEEGIKLKKKKK